MSCASCHAVRDGGDTRGGSFAGDLTTIYSDYRDRAMTLAIRRPCFKRLPESEAAAFLLPNEVFALKAYLMQTAIDDRPPSRRSAAPAGVPAEWTRTPPGARTRRSLQLERETPTRTRLRSARSPRPASSARRARQPALRASPLPCRASGRVRVSTRSRG